MTVAGRASAPSAAKVRPSPSVATGPAGTVFSVAEAWMSTAWRCHLRSSPELQRLGCSQCRFCVRLLDGLEVFTRSLHVDTSADTTAAYKAISSTRGASAMLPAHNRLNVLTRHHPGGLGRASGMIMTSYGGGCIGKETGRPLCGDRLGERVDRPHHRPRTYLCEAPVRY